MKIDDFRFPKRLFPKYPKHQLAPLNWYLEDNEVKAAVSSSVCTGAQLWYGKLIDDKNIQKPEKDVKEVL